MLSVLRRSKRLTAQLNDIASIICLAQHKLLIVLTLGWWLTHSCGVNSAHQLWHGLFAFASSALVPGRLNCSNCVPRRPVLPVASGRLLRGPAGYQRVRNIWTLKDPPATWLATERVNMLAVPAYTALRPTCSGPRSNSAHGLTPRAVTLWT